MSELQRTDEDVRLDHLAHEMSCFVDGWNVADVMQVCAALCAFSIREQTGDKPEEAHKVLNTMIKFMAGIVDGTDGKQSLQ